MRFHNYKTSHAPAAVLGGAFTAVLMTYHHEVEPATIRVNDQLRLVDSAQHERRQPILQLRVVLDL